MKFLLLLGLLPVIGSFLARKFMSSGVLRKEGDVEVSISGQELVEKVLKKGKAESVNLQVKKRPFLVLGPERLVLSPGLAASRKARDVAEAGLLAGLVLMARQQEKVVGWRTWAVKFGSAGPAFTAIAMTFGGILGRPPMGWAIGIVAAMLGLATIFLWLTLPVERAAGSVVSEMLEETPIVSRRSEGERLGKLVRASVWRRIVPGAVAWIGGK